MSATGPLRDIGFLLCVARDLVSQSLSAFCTSSLQNISAVSSLHSFSKTVLFLSLTFFGLVSSEHSCCTSFGIMCGNASGKNHKTLFYSDLYIIYGKSTLVNSFCQIFYFFKNLCQDAFTGALVRSMSAYTARWSEE